MEGAGVHHMATKDQPPYAFSHDTTYPAYTGAGEVKTPLPKPRRTCLEAIKDLVTDSDIRLHQLIALEQFLHESHWDMPSGADTLLRDMLDALKGE